MSRFQLSPIFQAILSFVLGFFIFGGSFGWLVYLIYPVYPPLSHVICVTLLPPFLCGLYVGLFFRQRIAKILSIVFTILLSFLYPIFTILFLNDGPEYVYFVT
ncbi:MAG: hypothetical protein KAQ95_11730, partial [Candidatus Heimdallarchaeota archaeon]|nr:hypothetical protein [Candidatus Heimdallarchaeota archaeon]